MSTRVMTAMMIRDITFQDLSSEDKGILSAQKTRPGTIVVLEHQTAREVAAKAQEEGANIILVLEKSGVNIIGAIATDWAVEQIRVNLNLPGDDFHTLISQMEEIPQEQVRQFHHEWLTVSARPPIYRCKCHNRDESARHAPLSCYE